MTVNISNIIIVVSTEYVKFRKKRLMIIIVKIKIIKDVVPERKVIAQVLENDIFKLK